VEDGQVNCEAKGEVLSAIEHTRGRRYETCPQRIGLAKKGDSTQEFLKELARRCRRAKPEDFDQIEQDLKKELSMNP